jgi:hypothetical protein
LATKHKIGGSQDANTDSKAIFLSRCDEEEEEDDEVASMT